MRLKSLLLLSLLAFSADIIDCRGRGGSSRGYSRSGNRFRSRSQGSYKLRSFRPKISSSRSRILFPTLGALAGIYIASRMRPRVRLRSYDDFDRVTVCPGFRTGFDPRTGRQRNYSYFVCPDNPDELWNTYCCQDDYTSSGFCCHSSQRKTATYASGFVSLAVFIGVALAVYFCCCRGRARRKHAGSDEWQSPANQQPDIGPSPYPTDPPMQTFPMPMTTPSMDPTFVPPQPFPPTSGVGSAWTTIPPAQKPPMDVPPPPYPYNETVPPYTVHPSAPPSSEPKRTEDQ